MYVVIVNRLYKMNEPQINYYSSQTTAKYFTNIIIFIQGRFRPLLTILQQFKTPINPKKIGVSKHFIQISSERQHKFQCRNTSVGVASHRQRSRHFKSQITPFHTTSSLFNLRFNFQFLSWVTFANCFLLVANVSLVCLCVEFWVKGGAGSMWERARKVERVQVMLCTYVDTYR